MKIEQECLLHCCGCCWDNKPVVHRGTEIDVSVEGRMRVNSCDHVESFSFSSIIGLRRSVVRISFTVGLPSIILASTIPPSALCCAYPARERVMANRSNIHFQVAVKRCEDGIPSLRPCPVRSAPWCHLTGAPLVLIFSIWSPLGRFYSCERLIPTVRVAMHNSDGLISSCRLSRFNASISYCSILVKCFREATSLF